jgi:superfamily II DNA/RNA helicase
VVGSSERPPGRKDIRELSHPEDKSKTLAKFRSGEITLVIATSVLEEGIDVSQCNLVIYFYQPANLKSYVQCRGRARLRETKLVMLLSTAARGRITEWEILEREMKQQYEMKERNIQELAELEEGETDQCECRKFRVPRTGALLDIDNAKGHLGRFCQRLSSHSYAEMRPQYIIQEAEETDGYNNHPLLRANIILPVTLDPHRFGTPTAEHRTK